MKSYGYILGRGWPLVVIACLFGDTRAAERWQGLLQRNPFVPDAPVKPAAPEPPPPYEFRGRSVENGVEYFSLYNVETKKSLWVSHGSGEMSVRNYSPAEGLVLIDRGGKTIRLALKPASPSRGAPQFQSAAAVTAATASAVPSPPAVNVSASEAQRLEQLAGEIRARRAQRRQQTTTGS